MRRVTAGLVYPGLLAVLLAPAALAQQNPATAGAAISFTGNFTRDTDAREFVVTLTNPGNIVARTFSYAGGKNGAGAAIPAGGFDPSLALFDSSGNLLSVNMDGGCGQAAGDPVNGYCWDSYLAATLPSGTYRVVLTQSTNTANGPTLADSFNAFCGASDQSAGNCSQTFTPDPNPGSLPPGFWDQSGLQRTSFYAVDITGGAAAAPAITSSAPPFGIAGTQYAGFTFTVQPSGNYTWSVISGALPAGLVLSASSGVLSGTPQTAGSFTFTIQATDGAQPVQQSYTIVVYNPLSVSSTSLPSGSVGMTYGPAQVVANGGSGSVTWSAGGLPANLSINPATGVIGGTPTSSGTASGIVITATDTVTGQVANAGPFSITIGYSTLTISSSGGLGEIAFGSAVSAMLGATGGKAPYNWSGSAVPAGLIVNAGGAVQGIPSQPGNYSFSAQVTDSQSPAATASVSLSLAVLGFTTGSTLPAGSTTSAYSQVFSAAGGSGSYTFTSSSLPAGLSLSGAALTGTPKAVGTYSFGVSVSDGSGIVAPATFNLLVTGPASPLSVPGGSLITGVIGSPYSATLTAAGGVPPYTWAKTGGTLPNGLTLNAATGMISGTVGAVTAFTITAQATDSSGAAASGVFTGSISPTPVTLFGVPFPNGIVGYDYPLQIITGSAGVGPYTITIDGTLPPGLSLSNGQISGTPTSAGTYSFTVNLADSSTPGFRSSAHAQVQIAASNANLILSSASLQYSLTTGSTGLPTPDSVTVRSSVVQQLLNYSVAESPAVSWLDVAGGGTTPGAISISLDSSALNLAASASPLTTNIVVTCLAPSPCAGSSQSIQVSLAVSEPASLLSFATNVVAFETPAATTSPLVQQVALQNIGGGSASITSASAGAGWLTVGNVPGSVTAGSPAGLTFTANPAGLAPGSYQTTVTIVSAAGTLSIPVTFNINPFPTITLSNTGAQFEAALGSYPGHNSGSFLIEATGSGPVNWTASVSPGAPWLLLGSGSTSGTATASSAGAVSYTIDPAAASALNPAQAYYAEISIGGAANSPASYEVVLNVVPATVLPQPDPEPAGLVFESVFGAAAAPAPQTVTVYSSTANSVPYSASAATADGHAWLAVSPSTGASSTTAPGISTITATPGVLPAGVYSGTVSYQFSAAAVRTVNVSMIIAPVNGTASGSSHPVTTSALTPVPITPDAGSSCAAGQLVPTQTGLVDNFAQPAAWPTPLSITLLDNCGSTVSGGQVVTTFSNGDPPLALKLVNAAQGLYSGTWTPRTVSGQVTITATVQAPGFSAYSAKITGEVVANAAPLLAAGGTLHIYNPLVGAPVGQGTILQIYGSNLAAAPAVPTVTPLPTTIGGTSVIIGGIPAPLYYVSGGQIDAQLPFELTAGVKYQVIVSANGALSTPDSVQVAAATPGIAAFVTGQVVAQHSSNNALVSETSPAMPGEYLVIYLAGLGAGDNAVGDGVVSPGNPLSRPLATPTLMLNGVSIPIYFSGLTPGDVGLYQMNFQVPPGTPNGDTQLVVSQAGGASNSAILPVHN